MNTPDTTHTPSQLIAQLTRISKTYVSGDNRLEVLKDFSLDISSGDFVAIQGKSGSGKTTLLNILGLLDSDYCGEYLERESQFDLARHFWNKGYNARKEE